MNIIKYKALQSTLTKFTLSLLLFTTFSGTLRKWVFVDNSAVGNIILFMQIVCPFVFVLLLGKIQNPFKRPIFIWYSFLLILLAFNPMNLTYFHGILGLLLHLGFWVIMGFYIYNPDLFKVEVLIKAGIVLAIIEIVLGYIQYFLSPLHFLNRYADMKQITGGIATVGDGVRVTGTFSYLGGYYSFMMFYSFLIWALLRRNYNGLLLLVLIIGGLVASFMSGSRSVVFTYIVFSLLMFIQEGRSTTLVRRLVLQALGIGIIAISVSFFLGDRFGVEEKVGISYSNFSGRVQSTRSSGEEESRILEPIKETIFFRGDYPLLGIGLGSTYQGALALFGTSAYLTNYGYYEEEWERIVLEGGFVLFFFKIFLFAFLYRHLVIPKFSKVVLLIYIFIFVPLVFNVYNVVFLFIGIMLLDKSYRLEKSAVSNAERSVTNSSVSSLV